MVYRIIIRVIIILMVYSNTLIFAQELNIDNYEIGGFFELQTKKNQPRIFVNTNDSYPFETLYFTGYRFNIAVKNNHIEGIFLESTPFPPLNNCSFKTPEGVYMGMTYAELVNLLPNSKIVYFPGWQYEVSLPSGWKVGFSFDADYTNGTLKPEEKVTSIYKN